MSDETKVDNTQTELRQSAVASDKPKVTEGARAEIAASALGRMMGVATATELQLLEGKIDLMTTKMASLGVKVDKVISQFGQMPTGSDLERIDVQIGALRTMIRDLTVILTGEQTKSDKNSKAQATETNVVTQEESSASSES
jgi:hypothetical protein